MQVVVTVVEEESGEMGVLRMDRARCATHPVGMILSFPEVETLFNRDSLAHVATIL